MKKIYILKAGSTFSETAQRLGDFDSWTTAALGPVEVEVVALDVERGVPLPDVETCAGVIITGSHSMVTDRLPWSIALEQWIPALLSERVPMLGICYGHQLLAQASGGIVDFHPAGKEVGTVPLELLPTCIDDTLFQTLPASFPVHATHSQTVLKLPPYAVRLAVNHHDSNHAFRLGECAWGVQFHPEYTPAIMRAYIQQQANALEQQGQDVAQLIDAVTETPQSAKILNRFARLCENRFK